MVVKMAESCYPALLDILITKLQFIAESSNIALLGELMTSSRIIGRIVCSYIIDVNIELLCELFLEYRVIELY